MQYHSPHAAVSQCRYIVASRWWHLSHIVHPSIEICAGVCFFLLSGSQNYAYADKRIVNIIEMYILRNNLQLE